MLFRSTGWVRIKFLIPARGLIGFRTEFLTETRGTGIMNHVAEGYEPWAGDFRTRPTSSLVADRTEVVTSYALFNLQERGTLFVGPGAEVYEGMIVGENPRPEDMDVNPTKEKKLTNVRSSTGEELERLIPPRLMSMEQQLEFCAAENIPNFIPTSFYHFFGALDIGSQSIIYQFAHHERRSRSEERRVGKECRSRWSPYH